MMASVSEEIQSSELSVADQLDNEIANLRSQGKQMASLKRMEIVINAM